jgi:hypothetical protein
MSNSLYLAVGFFGGTLVGVGVMALAAAGELRSGPKHGDRARPRSES